MKLLRSLRSWRDFLGMIPPPLLLIYTFVVLILVCTLLLWMPFSHEPGKHVSLLDCFFTAVSAACVTGLTTVDFETSFNFFGELVVALTIQFGGLGVMTFAALSFHLLGARLPLRSKAALDDSLFQRDAAQEYRLLFIYLFPVVFLCEAGGALLLFIECLKDRDWHIALWDGIFHSISAFCNAGFSRWGDSLGGQSGIFLLVISLLIIAGGLGNTVLVEFARMFKRVIFRQPPAGPRHFSYNSRVVIGMTILLLVVGAVSIYLMQYFCGLNSLNFVDACFQSVTTRTAGFSTFSQTIMAMPVLLLTIGLMFIGGSPGSCAGGVKTTSFAIWIAHIKAMIFNRNEAIILDRRIPDSMASRARQLISLAIIWNCIGLLILTITENASFEQLVFEQVSAFATVGLSMDFTPHLSVAGKLWICLTMYVGRLGPLTIALSVSQRRMSNISCAEGRIMIG